MLGHIFYESSKANGIVPIITFYQLHKYEFLNLFLQYSLQNDEIEDVKTLTFESWTYVYKIVCVN